MNPSPLDPLIAFHRRMFDDDARNVSGITTGSVPTDLELIRIGDADVEVTDSGELGGLSLSPGMNRYLAPPAVLHPYHRSLFYLRHACRNDHPGHTEREEFRGSLCERTVWYVIAEKRSLAEAAARLDIPVDDVAKRLHGAMRWLEEDIDRKQRIDKARNPQPSEDPTPTRLSLLECDAVNRAVADFDLEQRIWDSQVAIMRRQIAEKGDDVWVLDPNPQPHFIKIALDEWERRHSWHNEWSRRQAAIIEHRQTCDRCRRAA